MRKKTALKLKRLAEQESKSKEYIALMHSNPVGTLNKINKSIKKLWHQGKI
jgi:hypothetical protein